MTNDEYFAALEEHLQQLKECRNHSKDIAKGIIGDTLYTDDLFFSSALHKCVVLLDGFIEMLKSRNLICASILIRSLLDTCMRTFAAYIAEDRPGFIEGYLKGKRICDFRDDQGNMMQDYVLRERLDAYESGFSDVYKKASGYVHFSDTAFYASVQSVNDYGMEFTIGGPLKEKANVTLLEGADVFIHYILLEYSLLQPVVESKNRVGNSPDPKE